MGTREEITLSIIVPTIGRKEIFRLLESLSMSGITMQDEVLLMTDEGPREVEIPRTWDKVPIRIKNAGRRQNDWGMFARNVGMTLARKRYMGFIDDDDFYLPDALGVVKAALQDGHEVPHLFKVRQCPSGVVLWSDPVIRLGNVSTQSIFLPTNGPRASWPQEYAGDFAFIKTTAALYGEEKVIWRDDVIAELYPSWSR